MWKAELSRAGGRGCGGEGRCPCQEHTTQRFTKQILLELQKGSRPRSPPPTEPPLPGEKRPKLGLPLRPGAMWTPGTQPGCEGLLCHQPPPRHGGLRVPRPPRSQVTSAEPPPRRVPFPMEAEPTAGPGSPLPVPWAARRGAAGHTDTDRRTERETRQHRAAALARLRGCLAPPRRPPPAPPARCSASVPPPPAIRRAHARRRGPARPRGASRTRRRMEQKVITQGEVHCLRGVQLRAPRPRL